MITSFTAFPRGYEVKGIDLNSLCIRHPSATVLMKICSDRYRPMGIYNGDTLVIDRSKKIGPNSLVVYVSEGQLVLGRVFNIKGEAEISGAITHVIHTVKET